MIAKVDAAIALDQQVSHLKFLLNAKCTCVFCCHVCWQGFLVTVCLLKDPAFCEVFYAAEVI